MAQDQVRLVSIIGYEPSTAALGGIGRLLLAARKGGKLVYVGSVGTGFSHTSATAVRKQMDELVILKPSVSRSGRRQGLSLANAGVGRRGGVSGLDP